MLQMINYLQYIIYSPDSTRFLSKCIALTCNPLWKLWENWVVFHLKEWKTEDKI